MNRADALEYNAGYAGKGWHNIEEHYSNSYDRIKFDIVNVVIREEQISQGRMIRNGNLMQIVHE